MIGGINRLETCYSIIEPLLQYLPLLFQEPDLLGFVLNGAFLFVAAWPRDIQLRDNWENMIAKSVSVVLHKHRAWKFLFFFLNCFLFFEFRLLCLLHLQLLKHLFSLVSQFLHFQRWFIGCPGKRRLGGLLKPRAILHEQHFFNQFTLVYFIILLLLFLLGPWQTHKAS